MPGVSPPGLIRPKPPCHHTAGNRLRRSREPQAGGVASSCTSAGLAGHHNGSFASHLQGVRQTCLTRGKRERATARTREPQSARPRTPPTCLRATAATTAPVLCCGAAQQLFITTGRAATGRLLTGSEAHSNLPHVRQRFSCETICLSTTVHTSAFMRTAQYSYSCVRNFRHRDRPRRG